MNKNWKKIFATVSTATFLTAAPMTVMADKPEEPGKGKNPVMEMQPVEDQQKERFTEIAEKRAETILNRLERIEEENERLEDRMEDYFDLEIDDEEDSDDTSEDEDDQDDSDDSSEDEDDLDDSDDSSEDKDDQDDSDDSSEDEDDLDDSDDSSEDKDDQDDSDDSSEDEDDQDDSEDEDDQDEDSVVSEDEEDKEEEEWDSMDDGVNSLSGKLGAQENKLEAVESQISALKEWVQKKIGTETELEFMTELEEELTEKRQEVTELQTLLKENEQALKENVEKEEKQELEDKETTDEHKAWSVKFSTKMTQEKVDALNFFVFDENMELISVNAEYNAEEEVVDVLPDHPYNKGETYTLIIAQPFDQQEEVSLKQAVQMNFTVK